MNTFTVKALCALNISILRSGFDKTLQDRQPLHLCALQAEIILEAVEKGTIPGLLTESMPVVNTPITRYDIDYHHGHFVRDEVDGDYVTYFDHVKIVDPLLKKLERLEKFTPTAENINALPEGIRNYIRDLETRADPTGEVSQLTLTMDQNKQLQKELSERTSEADRLRIHNEALALLVQQTRSPEPEWIVNNLAELGVRVGDKFFFLYKGENIEYVSVDGTDGEVPLKWRRVQKREFGECCQPINVFEDAARKLGVKYTPKDPEYTEGEDWKPPPT